ncbi:unnamed protein product [Rhodiola kirilowii]
MHGRPIPCGQCNEAVAVTTAIQKEILTEMGIDATIGIASLGKINMDYESDQDLMIHFYDFVSREEMAFEEAELGEVKFAERVDELHKLQGQQLEMLKVMRKFTLVEQSEILQKIHQKLEKTNFQNPGVVMSSDEIDEIVPRCMK